MWRMTWRMVVARSRAVAVVQAGEESGLDYMLAVKMEKGEDLRAI